MKRTIIAVVFLVLSIPFETVAPKGLPQVTSTNVAKVEEEESARAWTSQDLELLACAIYQEAGADYISDETRLMVGCVIMNRVEHKLYPNTIHAVLTEKWQYGRYYQTGVVWPNRAKSSTESHAVQRAREIAERVLNGERVLDKDYVFQSEFKQSNTFIYKDGLYFCRYNG